MKGDRMTKFLTACFLTAGFAVLLFLGAVLGATCGAFAGWVVSLVWNDPIMAVLRGAGLGPDVALWQVGCAIGFIGGFFRTSVSQDDVA